MKKTIQNFHTNSPPTTNPPLKRSISNKKKKKGLAFIKGYASDLQKALNEIDELKELNSECEDRYKLIEADRDYQYKKIKELKELLDGGTLTEQAAKRHYDKTGELKVILVRVAIILEALNSAIKWELSESTKKEIQKVLPMIHQVLEFNEQLKKT